MDKSAERDRSQEIYEKFKALPGSEHIATANAIRGLAHLLRTTRARSILEIGTGIGTLTYAIIDTFAADGVDDFRLTSVEGNDFCLGELRRNLADRLDRFRLVHDVGEAAGETFDLVIVDGGDQQDDRFVNAIKRGGVVFVEGFRLGQRKLLESSGRPFATANIRSMEYEGLEGDKPKWGGAYWVLQLEPSLSQRIRLGFNHVWNGVLVTKRRQWKALRMGLGRGAAQPSSTNSSPPASP